VNKEFRVDLESDLGVEVEEIHCRCFDVGFENLVRRRLRDRRLGREWGAQASERAWAVIGEAQRISCAAIGKSVLQGTVLLTCKIGFRFLRFKLCPSTDHAVLGKRYP
jgi:hypothetical protein